MQTVLELVMLAILKNPFVDPSHNSVATEIFLSLILKNDPCLKNDTIKLFLGNFWLRNKYYPLREAFKKKESKEYISGFILTLPSQLVTQNLVTYFSKVQTHHNLRISDIKSNFFLLSEIIYSLFRIPVNQTTMMKSLYQIGDGVRGFEIEHLKALNPLTLIVKLLLLTITGDEMFLNS